MRGMAIGLTGGIGCGKSEVGRILARRGAVIVDADEYVHEALRPGTETYRKVLEIFGPEILASDGTIDRKALGVVVINDDVRRRELEKVIHPVVIRRIQMRVAEVIEMGRHAVGIVPLLFEVGMTDLWDVVVCVVSPEGQVLQRLAGRGLSVEEARSWMAAQMPLAEKAQRADFTIVNDGSLADLEEKTYEIWSRILERGVKT